MNAILYTLWSVLIVSAISLLGAITFAINQKKLQKTLQYLVAFSAGALLGDTFFHLLPEAVEEVGFNIKLSVFVLVGILVSFLIEKIIHWRHCHIPTSKEHEHPYAWMNIFGDCVHNFIDGIIIAASYLASIPLGVATTIAVILHEIPQEMGDFGILLHGGFTKTKALLFNFLTALTAFAGALITLIIGTRAETFTLALLPFTAGTFIYIAAADLIPEMHKEVKLSHSLLQLIIFVAGIGMMGLLLFVE